MSATSRTNVQVVIAPEGRVVVPAEVVRGRSLAPGQRVNVVITSTPRRRNMYGALADKVPDVSSEEIADERRRAGVTWRSADEHRQRAGRRD